MEAVLIVLSLLALAGVAVFLSGSHQASFADSIDLFPGYGEWGASMEIRGNGEMSWYIGAEDWHGTYSAEDRILHAQLTSDLEQSPQNWDLRITSENGTTGLEMDYQDMTIYWVYGDQEETASGNTAYSRNIMRILAMGSIRSMWRWAEKSSPLSQ